MHNVGFWYFAEKNASRLALAAPDGRHWSRGELLASCNQFSHGLRQLGLQAGDRVAAMLPNCAEYVALHLAATQIGCVLVPIDWEREAREVATILNDSSARVFVAHERASSCARSAVKDASLPLSAAFSIGDIEGFQSVGDLIARQPDTPPANRTAGAVTHYSAKPGGKLAASTQTPLSTDPETMAREMTQLLALFDIPPESHNVHYCGSGLAHPGVMLWVVNSLHYGHAVVLAEIWDALQMLQAIDQYRVTTSYMNPGQLEQLLQLPEELREQYDVASTRHMISASAPCPANVKRAMIDWWGESIYEYFGDDLDCSRFDCQNDQAMNENARPGASYGPGDKPLPAVGGPDDRKFRNH